MQVSAINSVNHFNHVNFQGKKNHGAKKLAAPAAATLLMLAPGAQSCVPDININSPGIHAEANAKAVAMIYMRPGCGGCGGGKHDTDTVYVDHRDTVFVPEYQLDTIYLNPSGYRIPQDIMDSLNIWRGDYGKIKIDGDEDNNGSHKDQILLNLNGLRDWDYRYPEALRLNLLKTNEKQAVYDHIAVRSNTEAGSSFLNTELKVSKVLPGDITVVRADGSESNKVSGLLFEQDGNKVFAHSNGKDSVFVYKFAAEGENAGKYVSRGAFTEGYLPKDRYGENFLLDSVLGEGTEDHMIQIVGKAMQSEALKELYASTFDQE